ncbi:hypothetical protein FI667_g4303, partial [Globisporangium splendens]
MWGRRRTRARPAPRFSRSASSRSLAYLAHGLLLVTAVLVCGAAPVRAEYVSAAQSNRAHCRIFLHATQTQTRFLLLESYADQDGVDIYDDFPVVDAALTRLAVDDVYKRLRPSFLLIQEFLLSRPKPLAIEPRHCHTHLMASGAAMRAPELEAQLDTVYERIHQETMEDAHFPFLLAREDLRTIPADLQSYFHVVGANYLDGKIAATLTPGTMELVGVLNLEDDEIAMVFDSEERWRRSKRYKHIPLNASDFFSREYEGYGRNAASDAITLQLLKKQEPQEKKLEHPCLFSGYNHHTANGEELTGRGDANKCINEIQSYVDKGNEGCSEGSFCVLNGRAQARLPGFFYGVGLLRSVVQFTNKVLQTKQSQDASVHSLQLPTPTLAALRFAADTLCATPFSFFQDANLVYGSENSDSSKAAPPDACFDLCYTIVLLKQFGMLENDERVFFASPMENASAVVASSTPKQTSHDDATWLTGAYLYLEAIQQRRNYAMEAELLAVQVTEGVPIGFNLSVLVLAAAIVFLYVSTGAKRTSSRGTYQRVINGAGKAKQESTHSTQAIMFVDDASE